MLRRRRLLSTLGTLLIAAAATAATVGSASAATTSTFLYVPLTADVNIQGTVTDPEEETVVVSTELTLRAGEMRRVSDQLELTLSSSEGAEVDNILMCWYLDPSSGWQGFARSSSGTNHPGSGAGSIALSESLLLHAANAGRYRCEVRSYTGDGRTDYYETALKSGTPSTTRGTWLQISTADEVGAHEWQSLSCDPRGTRSECVYLGHWPEPYDSAFVFQTPPDLWTAASDATNVDVVGTLQVTSCPYGTSSCTSEHWGDNGILGTGIDKAKHATLYSWLVLNQLYPDKTVCRIHRSAAPNPSNRFEITNSVHHLPISFHMPVTVSPNCRGSRRFEASVYVRWLDGNPVKIDGGTVNVINSVRTSAATVPNVVGTGQAQATAALAARGFRTVVAGSVVNPAPSGTVIDQDSPGGTAEPTGSTVYITVSLGDTRVPDLRGDLESSARQRIVAAGLTVGAVSHPDTCVDPGIVFDQSPASGTQVAPGTKVNLTVPACSGEPK